MPARVYAAVVLLGAAVGTAPVSGGSVSGGSVSGGSASSGRAAEPMAFSVAAPGATASGCDGVRARVDLTATGTVLLGAGRDCDTVLGPATLGLVTTTGDLSTGLAFVSRTDRVVDVAYTTTAGKTRERRSTATETRLVLAGAGGTRITIVVRASADGIAYRYELPAATTVQREASTYQVPTAAAAYLSPYMVYYENQYAATTASAAATGEYAYPALFRVGDNYVLLSESDVDGRYSGSRLAHVTGTGRYTVTLDDAQVSTGAGFVSPWRTAIIGSAATLVESTLNDDVAPASRIADTSWIRPGIVAWSWLDGTRPTQQNLAKQKSYVDHAAAQGWEYVLVDDGWKSITWMPELVAYAEGKGVKIMLWYNYQDLDTAAERDTQFTRITDWGVVGVKIDFMNSDSQARYRWYDDVLADTARYELMVDFHGSTIPHGIQRTWPHVMTMEAVHGGEHQSRTLQQMTALPFTRNAVGSMDYTAMAFQYGSRPHSEAAELALSVLYESGLQIYAGSIAAYTARPELQRFLRQVPSVWDETRLLSGDPATGATIARRNGTRWFIGSLRRGTAQTVSVPTTFLPPGRYLVEVITDGPALTRTARTISAGDPLTVATAENGGFAAQLCPAVTGRNTCDR